MKPHILDAGPATAPGLSDQISSSASDGSWQSLKNKFKQDYNWRITATIADADTVIASKKAARVKDAGEEAYNVYRDDKLIASNVSTTNFDVENAINGTYTVTAVAGGEESAKSNAVVFEAGLKLGDLNADGNIDASDVTALINKVLGVTEIADDICDINGDGIVNVSDVTALINIILAK